MSEKEMTLKQIVEISGAIDALPNSGLKVEVGASIALAKNQQKIKPFVDGFTSATKPPKDFDNYRKEVGSVFNDHAIKNSSGGFVLANGNPIFKDPETASKLLEEINRKYETTIKEKIEIDKKAEESLKEIHKLDLEDVKESAFSGSSESAVAIMTALMPIIKK